MNSLIAELSDKTRQSILRLLLSGPKTVAEIVESTGCKQPNISNHLLRLKKNGILTSGKSGRNVIYSLATSEIAIQARAFLGASTESNTRKVDVDKKLVLRFTQLATDGNELECIRIVDQLLSQGESVFNLYVNLIEPTLTTIGKWWEVGAIDIGKEHVASALIERLMARIALTIPPIPNSHHNSIIYACVEGNWHSFGLRIMSDILQTHGFRSIFLGANVPLDSIQLAVTNNNPIAIMLSCALPEHAQTTLNAIQILRSKSDHKGTYIIAVGGHYVIENKAIFEKSEADLICLSLETFFSDFLAMQPNAHKHL